MRHWTTAAITSFAIILAACGGGVLAESSGDGGSGGAGQTTTATTTSTSDTAASGGADAGLPPCAVQPDDPDAGFVEPTCADLASMIVASPALADAGGDGEVSPGETATLTVDLVEMSGKGFFAYPEVLFASDTPAATVTNGAVLYGIAACDSQEMSTVIAVDPSVAPGTVVHVVAKVGMLGKTCPDAFELTVPVKIQ